jgi:hypothetical protein
LHARLLRPNDAAEACIIKFELKLVAEVNKTLDQIATIVGVSDDYD